MPSRLKFVFAAIPLLVIATFAIAACGGDDDNGGSSPTQAPARPAATTAPPAATTAPPAASPTTAAAANPTQAPAGAGNSVTIADFSYNPARLNARAGQALQLTVTNAGNLPHTFTIAGVVDSGTISAGTNKVVSFTPSAAGTLIYFCTVHGQATMSGQITVAGATGSLPPPDAPTGGQSTSGSTTSPPATPASTGSYDYGY